MWCALGITLLCLPWISVGEMDWRDYNCPAPRSPNNGLSFIFRDGAIVHYKCHPGYKMRGRAYSHCKNNKWDSETPKCIPRDGYEEFRASTSYTVRSGNKEREHYDFHPNHRTTVRPLFDWDDKTRHPIPYGDNASRLPLINGIVKPSYKSDSVLAIGTTIKHNDDYIEKNLVNQEVAIAEMRQRQLEEVQNKRLGYTTIPRYGYTKPKYHGSIDVVVLPPNKSDWTHKTNKQRSRENKKNRRRKQKENKDWKPEAVRHKPETRVENNQKYDGYPNTNDDSSVSIRRSRHYRPPGPTPSRNNIKMYDPKNFEYDATCYESSHGKTYPLRAPQVPNAFAYKYEIHKHSSADDTRYQVVRYKCRHGYTLYNESADRLYCRENQWIGETPLCQ